MNNNNNFFSQKGHCWPLIGQSSITYGQHERIKRNIEQYPWCHPGGDTSSYRKLPSNPFEKLQYVKGLPGHVVSRDRQGNKTCWMLIIFFFFTKMHVSLKQRKLYTVLFELILKISHRRIVSQNGVLTWFGEVILFLFVIYFKQALNKLSKKYCTFDPNRKKPF